MVAPAPGVSSARKITRMDAATVPGRGLQQPISVVLIQELVDARLEDRVEDGLAQDCPQGEFR